MYRKILKTYDRKNNGKPNFPSVRRKTIVKPTEVQKIKEKETLSNSLEDPYDTTFDRIFKDYKNQDNEEPMEKSNTSNSESESDVDENSTFESKNYKVKSRLKKLNSSPEKNEISELINRKEPSKTTKRQINKNTELENKKKSHGKIQFPTNKNKLTDNDSINSNSILAEKQNFSDDSWNNVLKKKKSSKKIKFLAMTRKLIDESINSSNSISSEKENCSENELKNAAVDFSKLKTLSIPLVSCDRVLREKENLSKIRPCSVQISRLSLKSMSSTIELSVTSETEVATKKINKSLKRKSEQYLSNNAKRLKEDKFDQNSEKEEISNVVLKKKNKSMDCFDKKELVKNSRKTNENLVTNSEKAEEKKFRKAVSDMGESLKLSKSPVILKNCSINLTRVNSPKINFINHLVSSTPVVKKIGNVSRNELLPVNLEISNIASPINKTKIPPTPSESIITSKLLKEPSIRFEDINKLKAINLQNNWTANFQETTENWNDSSEYSEHDWETVSYNESQLAKEPSLQRKFRSFPIDNKTKSNSMTNSLKNNSSIMFDISSKNISSAISPNSTVNESKNKISMCKNLKVSLQKQVSPKRILDKSVEYEKSKSLFDDTKLENSSLEISNLSIDKKDLSKLSPVSVKLNKLENMESFKNSSLLNQSVFKGFEERRLSPMTSIPSSIVYSIVAEDSRNNSSLLDDQIEKENLLRSLAFEKSKCLNLNGKSKIFDQSCKLNFTNNGELSIKEDTSLNGRKLENSRMNLKMEKSQIVDKSILLKDSETKNGEESLITSDESFHSDENTSAISSQDIIEINLLNDSHDFGQVNESSAKKRWNSTEDLLTIPENKRKEEESAKYEEYMSQFKNPQRIYEDDVEDAETIMLEDAIKSQKVLQVEKEKMHLINEAVNNNKIYHRETLSRLTDPVRITERRKNYKNYESRLSGINEYDNMHSDETEVLTPAFKDVAILSDVAEEDSLTEDTSFTEQVPKQLFLKPGKSWARSLSILTNIHCENDVDKFSVGKGKQWRNSVISILDMQNEGSVPSCTKQQKDWNSKSPCKSSNGNVNFPRIDKLSLIEPTSPNRIFKRISIRVVPDLKKFDIDEDIQFLEAYGIPSSQSARTDSQRLSSLDENSLTASPEKNLVNLDDSVLKTVDDHPIATAKDVVLEKCRQRDYISFNKCYSNKFLKCCQKIGEGVYGEVFLYNDKENSSVIKIIPIEGDKLVNGEPQKKFNEILSEIVIAKELHDLRFNEKYNTSSFVEVKNIRCIMGKYPQKLIEHWNTFDNEKKSENDCPSMFGSDQLYISLELGNGGKDLEAFVFQNAEESESIFIQTAIALAVAEQSLEFEHRDLHWGNILISRTKKSQISYKLGNLEISLASNGLQVAIIDFTLSRMSYKGCCIFNDLALDPALFTAEGEYQFEIYRLMRDKLGNDWQTFEPFTNILWLHYTLDKMITSVRYNKKGTSTKIHKNAIERLKKLKSNILSYDSAYELVTKCDKFTVLFEDLNCSTDDNVK